MTVSTKSNQHKSNFKKSSLKVTTIIFATTAAIFSLSACEQEQYDKTTAYGKAKYDVKFIRHEVHAEYLNCYPLAPAQKNACTEKVANKWLKPKFEREYKGYRKTFQHESEKLGFKYFLNNKDLACDALIESPKFDYNKEAYLVLCKSNKQYLMQFDYDNKQWNIKNVS